MEQRIRRDLAFLFEEHGATVRSNTVDSFGFSQILITAGNVEFRFTYLKREDDCQLAVGPSDVTASGNCLMWRSRRPQVNQRKPCSFRSPAAIIPAIHLISGLQELPQF